MTFSNNRLVQMQVNPYENTIQTLKTLPLFTNEDCGFEVGKMYEKKKLSKRTRNIRMEYIFIISCICCTQGLP